MKNGYNIKQQYNTRNFFRKCWYKMKEECSVRFGVICMYLYIYDEA